MNQVAAISAWKTFYNAAHDPIDVFNALILHVFEHDKRYSIDRLTTNINKFFSIQLPETIVKTGIKRLRRQGIVDSNNRQSAYSSIFLTSKGKKKKIDIDEQVKEEARKEIALINDLNKFLDYKYKNNLDFLKKSLYAFINNNPLVATNSLLRDSKSSENMKTEDLSDSILKFFQYTEQQQPENFKRLKTLLLGALLVSCVLNSERPESNIKSKISLGNVSVYIDSNIFFSLLELHQENINRSVTDAIAMIRDAGGKLKMFAHTREEIIKYLQNYTRQSNDYSIAIPVDSINYNLKMKGFDIHEVQSLITNLDRKLREYKITVDYVHTEKIIDTSSYNELRQSKPDQHPVSFEHDCQSIEYIRKLRKPNADSCYLIEKCKTLFLTADYKLSNFSKRQHKQNETIPEAFSFEQLFAVLWIRNNDMEDNSFVNSFVSHNIKVEIIREGLWEEFLLALENYKKNNSISQDQINELISRNSTRTILLEKGEAGIKEIFSEANIAQIIRDRESDAEELTHTKNELRKEQEEKIKANRVARELQRKIENIEKKNRKHAMWQSSLILSVSALFLIAIIEVAARVFIPYIPTDKGLVVNLMVIGGPAEIISSLVGVLLQVSLLACGILVWSRRKFERHRKSKCPILRVLAWSHICRNLLVDKLYSYKNKNND